MNSRLDNVREFFNKLTYLEDSRDRIWVRTLIIRKFLLGFSPKVVLDIGCGDGSLSLWLLPKIRRLILNDLSEQMVRQAERRGSAHVGMEKIEYRLGDISTIDLDDETFDLVICVGLLAHVDDPQRLLKRLDTLIRKRGVIILETSPDPKIYGSRLRGIFKRLGKEDDSYNAYEKNRVSLEDLNSWCDQMGWMIMNSARFSLPFIGFGFLPVWIRCAYSWISWRLPVLSNKGNEHLVMYQKL